MRDQLRRIIEHASLYEQVTRHRTRGARRRGARGDRPDDRRRRREPALNDAE
jgi:hypothetical protein